MVDSAVNAGAEARVGALAVGPALALLGAATAFAAAWRHGAKEATGRAVISGTTFAWQGAWLGALIAGGFVSAGGGAWVIAVALGAVLVGGLIGLGVGLRLWRNEPTRILNGILCGGVVGGFAASFLWSAPVLTAAASDPVAASPVFGPSADWIWRTAGAAPLVLAALFWWVHWMRREAVKPEERLGWGLGAAALVFVAAMAAGLGAIVGGLSQIGLGWLACHVAWTPTTGTWAGACLALFLFGTNRPTAPR